MLKVIRDFFDAGPVVGEYVEFIETCRMEDVIIQANFEDRGFPHVFQIPNDFNKTHLPEFQRWAGENEVPYLIEFSAATPRAFLALAESGHATYFKLRWDKIDA